jgi:hypothetical protein
VSIKTPFSLFQQATEVVDPPRNQHEGVVKVVVETHTTTKKECQVARGAEQSECSSRRGK